MNGINPNVIITCAITGAGDTLHKHPDVPVTPEQIATSALLAAEAGAAVVHCHVRDPISGQGSRDTHLYAEVVERIRAENQQVIINLTAGMGGDLYIGAGENPTAFEANTDLVGASERLKHVREILPDICTIDCGSFNFGDGSLVYVSTPDMLRAGIREVERSGVRPEFEVFDSGQLWFVNQLIAEGCITQKPLIQLCLGIPWGAPANTTSMKSLVDQLPSDADWASFGIGAQQMPMVAQSILLGGHVRVGLEDNLYVEKGVLASNADLVTKARGVIEAMGSSIQSATDARATLGLRP